MADAALLLDPDSPRERAVRWAAELLLGHAPELTATAEERARNILGAVIGGEPGAQVGNEMLRAQLPGPLRCALRRTLGARCERVWWAVRDGWCEAALAAYVRRETAVVEVTASTAEEAERIARECWPGLCPALRYGAPDRIGPGRFRLRLQPLPC